MQLLRPCGPIAIALGALLAPGADAQGVTHVRVEGALDMGTVAQLVRASNRAREQGDRLVIEIDTPGGSVELMWKLRREIEAAADDGVLTVAWVNDRALSAGSLLALACEKLYMRERATIGSALPVVPGIGGIRSASEDPDVREKLYSSLRAEFRAVAESHGRPGLLAEAMVDPSVEVRRVRVNGETLLMSGTEWRDRMQRGEPLSELSTVCAEGELFGATGAEAVAYRLADGLAESLEEVVEKTGPRAEVVGVPRASSDDFAAFVATWAPLLLVLAFVLAFVELKTPGFGVAGIASIACFALVLSGRYLVGLAGVPQLVLIGLGVVLVAVEIFVVPGSVWVGLAGAFAILSGVVWSIVASSELQYGLSRRILLDETVRVCGAALVAMIGAWILSRWLPRTPVLGWLVLDAGAGGRATAEAMPEARDARARTAAAGAPGRAVTDLRPVGKVVLDAEPALEFEALASGPAIETGARVRVVEVQPSYRLVVEPEEEGAGSPSLRA